MEILQFKNVEKYYPTCNFSEQQNIDENKILSFNKNKIFLEQFISSAPKVKKKKNLDTCYTKMSGFYLLCLLGSVRAPKIHP